MKGTKHHAEVVADERPFVVELILTGERSRSCEGVVVYRASVEIESSKLNTHRLPHCAENS